MSQDWVKDIEEMHLKFGVREWMIDKLQRARINPYPERYDFLRKYVSFRMLMIYEELGEMISANSNRDSEEVVDALIDICVFAIGTLDILGVDSYKAWDDVLEANMNKEVGVKEGRPNPFGLPDLVKPEGWSPPSHKDNHGALEDIFDT